MKAIFGFLLIHLCIISFISFIILLIVGLKLYKDNKELAKEFIKSSIVSCIAWIVFDFSTVLILFSLLQENMGKLFTF